MRKSIVLLVFAASSPISSARAEPRPCAATGPYVVITAPHPAPAGVEIVAVVERLQQELAGRGVELCAGTPPAPAARPLATIRLGTRAGDLAGTSDAVALDIEVHDDVTAKRIGREVDLSSIPRDGRAIVVALAADELLRASWAELSLERVPKPRVPVAPALRSALDPRSEPRSHLAFGGRGAADFFSGGLSLFGGDAFVSLPIARRWSVLMFAGARSSASLAAPDGTASARGAVFGAAARLLVTSASHGPSLSIDTGPVVDVIEVRADAAPGARATSHVSGALAFETGPTLRMRLLDPGLSIVLGASVGVVARGFAMLDGSSRIAALEGASATASLGIEAP